MNPIKFEGATIVGAPKNWDPARNGKCHGLPCEILEGGDGLRSYTSVWAFSDQERAAIAAGQNLAVTLLGSQVPMFMEPTDIQGEVIDLSAEPETPRPVITIREVVALALGIAEANSGKVTNEALSKAIDDAGFAPIDESLARVLVLMADMHAAPASSDEA